MNLCLLMSMKHEVWLKVVFMWLLGGMSFSILQRKVFFNSDSNHHLHGNDSSFASQDFIPYVYYASTRNGGRNLPVLVRWKFSETHAGRTRTDNRFFYLNLSNTASTRSGNDVLKETDTVKAILCQGEVAGATNILLVWF